MVYAQSLLPVLIVFLLVAVAALRRTEGVQDRSRALAQLGFGLAKICLLALPLEWLGYLFQHGEPLAVSGKAVWLAALAQTCQIFLVITGVADAVAGIAGLRGQAVAEMHHSPCRAGAFDGMWRRLMPGLVRARVPYSLECVPVMLLVAGAAALWHGDVTAVAVWLVIHYLLVMLEGLRQKPLFAPLPLPLRVILVLLVTWVTSVLLISPNFTSAVANMKLMFASTKPTLYSLLLDKRLTSGWLQFMLLFSVITCVGLPRLGWVLEQPIKSWRAIGVCLMPLSLLLVVRESAHTPGFLRQAAQWPVTWLFSEGNSRVHVGYEGWLFPIRELDRRTLSRRESGAGDELVKLAAELKVHQVPLMVVTVPAKLALYPDQMLRAEYAGPVQPPGLSQEVGKLQVAGIDVLDPAPALWQRLVKDDSHYASDSHWTFEAMKEVAAAVAKRIREKHPQLYLEETPLINATILERTDAGDLAKEFLPLGARRLFADEDEQLVSIRGLDHDAKSPILVLGDEAVRVFEDASASFGNREGLDQKAGFASQLAVLLGRSLDVKSLPKPLSELSGQMKTKKLIIIVIPTDDL